MELNEAEAAAIFAFIFSRIKQTLMEGYDFTIPGFGAFLRHKKRAFFVPAKELDELIKTGQGLDVVDIPRKKGKK